MSATALRTATGTDVATSKPTTIAGLLTDPKIKSQMALAMPKHMTADRLARIALTEVRRVPKLAQCDQTSFLGAIMQCAQLGLEPGGALGHAYLLPFDKRKKEGNQWKTVGTEVQLIVGYRGMIDLARRSGQIISIEARVVHAKDFFEVELGLDSRLVHRPAWGEANRGDATFAYAVAKLKDGGLQFEVMSKVEIEAIRARSKAKDSGPWVTDWEEMAKKTVIRRLFKYLPVSIEIQRAVGLDEQAEAGISQNNGLVIDGEYANVTTDEDNAHAITDQRAEPGTTGDGISAQEVHDALVAAKDIDALDAAADLIRLLPEAQRGPLGELYAERTAELSQ